MRRPLRGDRRVRRSVVVLFLATAFVLAAAPLTAGDRPPAPAALDPAVSAWTPPSSIVSPDFATLQAVMPGGGMGSWRVSPVALPLAFAVERQVVDRLGLDAVTNGLTAWNAIPGSTFSAEVVGVVDDGVGDRRRDGVSRVFLAPDSACGGVYLARAHIWPARTDVRDGRRVVYVTEVDIGICGSLDRDRAHLALRHEVAHAAGLGHLCEPDDDCWEEAMGAGHGCRVMYRRARSCVEVQTGDLDGFRHLYPAVPRLGGRDATATSVEASRHLFPTRRTATTVVMASAAGEPDLVLASAAAAGAIGAPLLLVGDACAASTVADELNRVAGLDATVAIVGRVPDDCPRLLYGWDLPTVAFRDATSLAGWVLRTTGRSEVRLVSRDLLETDPTLVASIAAAAGRDRTPLAFTSADHIDRDVAALLDEAVTRVESFVTPASAGLVPALRRLVSTGSETVDALTPHRLAARAGATGITLTGSSWAEAAVAAASAGAGASRWPVVPVDGALDAATEDTLRNAGDAVVVGGEPVFPPALQRDASQAVDAGQPDS